MTAYAKSNVIYYENNELIHGIDERKGRHKNVDTFFIFFIGKLNKQFVICKTPRAFLT